MSGTVAASNDTTISIADLEGSLATPATPDDEDSATTKLPKKDDEEKPPEEPAKTVPFSTLLRYGDACDKTLFYTACVISCLTGAVMPMTALLIGLVVDMFCDLDEDTFTNPMAGGPMGAGGGSGDSDANTTVALIFFIIFMAVGVGLFLGYLFMVGGLQVSAARQQTKIKAAYFRAVLRQEVSWFDKTSPGELSSRINGDTLIIEEALGNKFGGGLSGFFQLITGFVIGFFYSWRLTLVVLGVVPLMCAAIGVLMSILSKFTSKTMDASAHSSKIAGEAISAQRTVIAMNMQAQIEALFKVDVDRMEKFGNTISKNITLAFAIFMGLQSGLYSLALWYGSTLVKSGGLTSGEVFIVLWAVMMGGFGATGIITTLQVVQKGKVAGYKVFEVIDRVPTIDSASDKGLRPAVCHGELELKDVHFTYPSRPDVPIFKGYSLKVGAGQTVALVGESGGGKSTVIGLLERFYDPAEGQVLLDGVNLTELNVQWLREQIGLVSQEPTLFATSIIENIRYGKPGASDEEVFAAAKMSNAHDFVKSFPDGYKTEVGERGVQLSGGQKQRVAIARAIIKDPTILLLDEATSALDSESERVVQAALDRLLSAKKRTTVVVAHRLSTVKDADSIAVIYDGRIVEQGSHAELVQIEDGYYHRLHDRQSQQQGEKRDIVVSEIE
jgi:ABC-type multidrug transport system fused ATPase/permease subunit